MAIQIWIARAFPEAALLPSEPQQEIKAIAFLTWCASGIHPRLTPNALPHRYCAIAIGRARKTACRCAQKLLRAYYRIAEDLLSDGRDWFFERFSAADAYFFWCFRRGTLFGLDLSEFSRCQAHFERMQQRQAFSGCSHSNGQWSSSLRARLRRTGGRSVFMLRRGNGGRAH